MHSRLLVLSIIVALMALLWWVMPNDGGQLKPEAARPQSKPTASAMKPVPSSKAAPAPVKKPDTEAAPPFTSSALSVAQQCQAIFNIGNATERLAAFEKLLASTTDQAGLKTILDTLNALFKIGRRYDTEWATFWRTIGHRDPTGTMALIASYGSDTDWYKGAVNRVLTEWSSQQPEAAMQWLEANKVLTGEDFDQAARALISGFAARDLEAATDYAIKVFKPKEKGSGSLFQLLTSTALQQRGMDGMIAWFHALPNGPAKVGLFNSVANRLQEIDPAKKRAWLEAEARQPYRNDLSYRQLVQEIADQDPRAGMDYVSRMPRALDGGMPGVGAAAFAWLEKDVADFTHYYQGLPAGELKTNILKAVNNSLTDPNLSSAKRIVATQFVQTVAP